MRKNLRKIEAAEEDARKVRDAEKDIFDLTNKWDRDKQTIIDNNEYIKSLEESKEYIDLEIEGQSKAIEKIREYIKELEDDTICFIKFREWIDEKNCSEKRLPYTTEIYNAFLKHINYNYNEKLYMIKISEEKIEYCKKKIEKIEDVITDTKNHIKALNDNINNYDRKSQKKALPRENHTTNKAGSDYINKFNCFKEDEQAHLKEQLGLIKKYGKDNNTKKLNDNISQLHNQRQKLEAKKDEIEMLEKANWRRRQKMVLNDITRGQYLDERKFSIPFHKSDDERFKAFNDDNSYKAEDTKDMRLMKDHKRKKFEKSKREYESTVKNLQNMNYDLKDVNSEIHQKKVKIFYNSEENNRIRLSELISETNECQRKIGELQAKLQNNDEFIRAEDIHTSIKILESQLTTLNSRVNKQKKAFNKNSSKFLKQHILYEVNEANNFQEKINKQREKLFIKKDEKYRCELDYLSIFEDINDLELKEIAAYHSELAAYQEGISNLKRKIDTELAKIRSQFEADIQDLQRPYDEKELELASLKSELTTLEESMQQQETRRQTLQEQVDKLALRVNATHSQREIIAQELEGHRQKAEELGKDLADAEQKKKRLGTKLEEYKHRLIEEEKKLNLAESEWKKAQTDSTLHSQEQSSSELASGVDFMTIASLNASRYEQFKARMEAVDDSIIMARSYDEDRKQMLKAKFDAIIHRKDWRLQWITKRPWNGAG